MDRNTDRKLTTSSVSAYFVLLTHRNAEEEVLVGSKSLGATSERYPRVATIARAKRQFEILGFDVVPHGRYLILTASLSVFMRIFGVPESSFDSKGNGVPRDQNQGYSPPVRVILAGIQGYLQLREPPPGG
jgi:hypothetical protein